MIEHEISGSVLNLITTEQAWYYRVIPVSCSDKTIELLSKEQEENTEFINELSVVLGYEIKLKKIPLDSLNLLLNKYYRINKINEIVSLSANSENFIIDLIKDAKNLKSSDIHIEIYEDTCRIRLRIDGLLIERYKLNKDEYPSVINKIKIMANLDIAEKRLPQDGRIFFEHENNKFDIRISVLPTLFGEKIVLRLLNNDATEIDIYTLGFEDKELNRYLDGIRKPNGILLISGPTGSGKTTTLYATLKLLNKETRNVLTIEDPVEYTLEGINQVQLKENIGFGFASALRTFLRQDPDVIMVGEIRDAETAAMAIRASLTGHLVLSTIHTNSAWGIVSRMLDMGVPSFLLANTLNTAVAQRLVRLLCTNCKKQVEIGDVVFPIGFIPDIDHTHLFIAEGCDKCYHTGYSGRKAIYEVISIDSELSSFIKSNTEQINSKLKEKGIESLRDSAYKLLKTGSTSIDEVYSLLSN